MVQKGPVGSIRIYDSEGNDITNLAPATNQTDGTQKTQIVQEVTESTGNTSSTNLASGATWAGVTGVSERDYEDWIGLAFYTHENVSLVPTEKMRLDSYGNLGIGTTNPIANLQVTQGTVGMGTVSVGAGGTTWNGSLTQFTNTFKIGDTITSEGQTKTITSITSNILLTTDAVGEAISGKAYTLAGGDRFSVLGNGNVGIGTNDPDYTLEVSGTSRITGDIYWANTVLNPADGFASQTGAGFDASAGEFQISANNNVPLFLGRFGGTGTLLDFRYASNQIGTISTDATDLTIEANADLILQTTGNVGIGTTTPTAKLHLPAGTATASTAPLKFTEGTLLTTPEKGVLEFADGKLYMTNNAKQKALDRTSDVALATVTVADTTTETTLYTAPIAANSLEAGNVFKVHCDGSITNDSGTAGDEVTLRIYVGASATPVATLETDTRQLTDQDWHFNANATQRTIGSTGQRAVHIHLEVGDATARGDITSMVGIATIDTTANMDIKITAEWATAETNNTISLYQGYTEYKN